MVDIPSDSNALDPVATSDNHIGLLIEEVLLESCTVNSCIADVSGIAQSHSFTLKYHLD